MREREIRSKRASERHTERAKRGEREVTPQLFLRSLKSARSKDLDLANPPVNIRPGVGNTDTLGVGLTLIISTWTVHHSVRDETIIVLKFTSVAIDGADL